MNLKDLVSQNRNGLPKALPSFCTANEYVLDDIVSFAAYHKLPLLIEATCNQVNQFGGYTGMKPADYVATIRAKTKAAGLSENELILGGDHLGPNPWRHLPAQEAMNHAKTLVRDYVEAGFTKIHLDTSMACQGESTPSFELVAKRSAELCVIAEQYAPDPNRLHYVIGTEVPVPGGEADDMSRIQVTTPERFTQTIDTHKTAFHAEGVAQGIERVIAVVVQPGVDFSHENVIDYDRSKAAKLTASISGWGGLGFEAHSTDYQSTENLAHLVKDHAVILKVGPEITFRFREGLMALDHIEALLNIPKPARVMNAVQKAMAKEPADWNYYYKGKPEDIHLLKYFSYSDRIRYYWDKPLVAMALKQLINNITDVGIPAGLASQYGIAFPLSKDKIDPKSLISQRVKATLERYYRATGWV